MQAWHAKYPDETPIHTKKAYRLYSPSQSATKSTLLDRVRGSYRLARWSSGTP